MAAATAKKKIFHQKVLTVQVTTLIKTCRKNAKAVNQQKRGSRISRKTKKATSKLHIQKKTL